MSKPTQSNASGVFASAFLFLRNAPFRGGAARGTWWIEDGYGDFTPGGQTAAKDMLVDLARLEREYCQRRPGRGRPEPVGKLWHKRASRVFSERDIYRSPHTGHHAGYLRLPPQPKHHRAAVHGEGHACAVRTAQRTALEVLAANDVVTFIQPDDGVTPTPVISRAIIVYNRGRQKDWPTASSLRLRTIRRRMADSNITRPTVGPRIPILRSGCRIAPTNYCVGRTQAEAMPYRDGAQGGDHARGRFCFALCERSSGTSSTWRHSSRRV